MFIDGLAKVLESIFVVTKFFADDVKKIKVYLRNVKSDDCVILQKALDVISCWASDWLLKVVDRIRSKLKHDIPHPLKIVGCRLCQGNDSLGNSATEISKKPINTLRFLVCNDHPLLPTLPEASWRCDHRLAAVKLTPKIGGAVYRILNRVANLPTSSVF